MFWSMLARIDELQQGVFDPDRGSIDPNHCNYALELFSGFFGPFVDVPMSEAMV